MHEVTRVHSKFHHRLVPHIDLLVCTAIRMSDFKMKMNLVPLQELAVT